jgi:hypothetical protein
MAAKKNAIAKDLRSPKYRLRVVKSKKAYVRRPKHAARAADGFSELACQPSVARSNGPRAPRETSTATGQKTRGRRD